MDGRARFAASLIALTLVTASCSSDANTPATTSVTGSTIMAAPSTSVPPPTTIAPETTCPPPSSTTTTDDLSAGRFSPAEEFITVALGDERFEALIRNSGGTWRMAVRDAVGEPTGCNDEVRRVIVDVRFVFPAPIEQWPGEVCQPDVGDPDTITGIRWMIDTTTREILAVSPVWDDKTACGDAFRLSTPIRGESNVLYVPERVLAEPPYDPPQSARTDRAAFIAFSDKRLWDLLLAHRYEVAIISLPRNPEIPDTHRVVDVPLLTPADPQEWHIDTCAIPVEDPAITGVRWLIDVEEKEISAVSPVWGDVSCGY